MEDANSVYVGGLSYESSEETVKKAFMEFGDVVSVKIVYDRESGDSRGFGFVTFTNPRAAVHAIREMDGGQIEGRTIRVNEVRKNVKGLGFRDLRGGDNNRDVREFRGDRDFRDRGRRLGGSPPLRERGGHRNRSPPLRRSRSPAPRGGSPNGSLGRYQSLEAKERSRSPRSSVSPQSSEGRQRKAEWSVHKGGSKLSSRVTAVDKDDGGDLRQVRDELERARQNRRELEEKVANLKGVVEKAEVTIAALHSKSQKLEDSLTSALQMAAQRQSQLKRLQTSVFHFKLCTERLVNSEKEMKALAALTTLEVEHELRAAAAEGADAAAALANGNGGEQHNYHGDEHFMTA